MEKIYLDDSTFFWRKKLNLKERKEKILEEAKAVIKSLEGEVKSDGFGYKDEHKNIEFDGKFEIKNCLDEICLSGIEICKQLYNQENGSSYNKVNMDAWVNVVRSKDPVQMQFKHDQIKGVDKFHNHVDLNKKTMSFIPDFTYVYYIQMPDIMEGEEGVLYFRSKDKKEYYITPEEDDIIIMPGWMDHAPNNAPKSNLDRIVLAGNVGFQMIKKEKSLL